MAPRKKKAGAGKATAPRRPSAPVEKETPEPASPFERVRVRAGTKIVSGSMTNLPDGSVQHHDSQTIRTTIASCGRVYIYVDDETLIVPPEMDGPEVKAHVDHILAEAGRQLDGLDPYDGNRFGFKVLSFPVGAGGSYERDLGEVS